MSVNPNEVVAQCSELLDRIINDNSVPRNIRRSANEAKNTISDPKDPPSMRAAEAIPILDEISNDPNIPLHTRTLVWQIAGQLETIPIE